MRFRLRLWNRYKHLARRWRKRMCWGVHLYHTFTVAYTQAWVLWRGQSPEKSRPVSKLNVKVKKGLAYWIGIFVFLFLAFFPFLLFIVVVVAKTFESLALNVNQTVINNKQTKLYEHNNLWKRALPWEWDSPLSNLQSQSLLPTKLGRLRQCRLSNRQFRRDWRKKYNKLQIFLLFSSSIKLSSHLKKLKKLSFGVTMVLERTSPFDLCFCKPN